MRFHEDPRVLAIFLEYTTSVDSGSPQAYACRSTPISAPTAAIRRESKPADKGRIHSCCVFRTSAMAACANSCISSTKSSQPASHRLWLGSTVHNCSARKPFSSQCITASGGTTFIPLYNVQSEMKCPYINNDARP